MTKKTKKENLSENESMSNWSRKMFGYTKNGKYYRDK